MFKTGKTMFRGINIHCTINWLISYKYKYKKITIERKNSTSHFSINSKTTRTLRFDCFEILINTNCTKYMTTFTKLFWFCTIIQTYCTSIYFYTNDKDLVNVVFVLKCKKNLFFLVKFLEYHHHLK